ncbi:MAG: LysR family transcriptional regulator, low CO2-responsive transcriptional regulator [Solirubrobacteraceae bacterium]|nr:LysR family transcriptional regulator, low CO2-responsive transcriptional regulator [Solirubrobacteraceae bacterium]
MTLSQLRSFLTVARLGTVKAAARALEVSEPAVSGAVGSLRRELGDPLYVRAGGVIELTPGGRRLASAAGAILDLEEEARRAIDAADAEKATLRVAATSPFAEFAAGPLLSAFSHHHRDIEVDLTVARREDFAALLANRSVDITLGPPVTDREDVPAMVSEAFLRYGLIVVAAPNHTLATSKGLAPAALVSTPWLLGPFEHERSADTGAFLARQSIAPRRTRAYPNCAAALAQVASGRGVTLAIAHTVRDELERGALVELDVRGTPISGLWFVSTLREELRTPSADELRRFVTMPEATRAMLTRGGGVPAERFVHMGTRWS